MNEPEILPRLEGALPPAWTPVRSNVVEHLYSLRVGGDGAKNKRVRRFHLLYSDAVRVARSLDLDEVLRALEADLQLFVATEARNRLFVHAGVVGWRGRAILFPGTSGSGKTTLVTAMVRAGASYYSDEYAVLDSRGRVHPYARALVVRDGPGTPRKVAVSELGGQAGTTPLPVGLVVPTTYEPGARWRPRPLSPGKGAMELLANTVAVRLRPELALSTLTRAVGRFPVLKGARGEAEELAASLLRTLRDRAA